MDALTYSHFSFSYAGAQPGVRAKDQLGARTGAQPGTQPARQAGACSDAQLDEQPGVQPSAPARVLEDVTWSVEQGAFVLLVGDTGSGKTTLLRCAKPEIAPAGQREGQVAVFGKPQVKGACEPDVGYVFQSPENQIVCDTVWHELAFGLENRGVSQSAMRRRVAEVAHFFGIEPWFHCGTASLSGGQKQLVNLAAVLAMQPRVLLLDEPTAQLDPVAQHNFLHALFRVNRELGVTVVVATHAPEAMVDYATAAAHVEDGRVVPIALDELRPCVPCEPARGQEQAQGSSAHGICGGRTGQTGEAHAHPCADAESQASAAQAGCVHVGQASGMRSDATEADQMSDPCSNGAEAAFLDDVFFRYARDGQWVLRGMSFCLSRGRIHAIVGGNGCGKSTALRVLAGVLRPERGRVRNALQREQALLPQDPRALLVCDTVRDELAEWSDAAGYGAQEINTVMEYFGISDLSCRHPFDTSGGQQQKIALAKLLLTRPQLLLLDEPAKGLDAPSKVAMAHTFAQLRDEGMTIVLVTHDLAFASCVADDVTMLFDGEAACQEPTRAFFENNLFYRAQPNRFMQLMYAQEGRVRAGREHVLHVQTTPQTQRAQEGRSR